MEAGLRGIATEAAQAVERDSIPRTCQDTGVSAETVIATGLPTTAEWCLGGKPASGPTLLTASGVTMSPTFRSFTK